jgi:DNA-binding IclR family transcriptional regulator
MAKNEWARSGTQALTRGLEVLRILVETGGAMTGVELAARVGLPPSQISRTLGALAAEGYVVKTAKGYAPDYGILSLASAARNFSLVQRPRKILEEAAEACEGALVTLSMLWRDRIFYFLRGARGADISPFWLSDFPLHHSAPGMRMLLGLPPDEALRILEESGRRTGWAAAGPNTPTSPRAALDRAASLLQGDTLVLDGWHVAGEYAMAVPVHDPSTAYPVAFSVTAKHGQVAIEKALIWLGDYSRLIERSLAGPTPRRGRPTAAPIWPNVPTRLK